MTVDTKTTEKIIAELWEAFQDICERHEVQTFEDDFENIEDAVRSIQGF